MESITIKNSKDLFKVDEEGFYGNFGGAYIPEILHSNVENLQNSYLKIINEASFQEELSGLLADYAGRPSPLYFAKRMSERYDCKIYLKREDLNHTGAHKINNVLGQILLAEKLGKTRIIAETGAGQHGVATATVCALRNLKCIVYMGSTDVKRQRVNVEKMKMLGAEVRPVYSGSMTLKDATNEAIRDWCSNPEDTYYVIGSTIGPHPYPDMVAKFQSVISKELKKQLMKKIGRDYPDYLIACVGGGSNAAGTFYEYLDNKKVKLIAAEAAGKGINSGYTAATMHVGREGVLHGCRTIFMQNDDGQVQEAYSISAGLDYPGVGPLHAFLATCKRSEVLAITDTQALDAAFELTRTEGIVPALESSHALAVLKRKKFKKDDIVVITVSGRGDKDMDTYIKYMNNSNLNNLNNN